MAAALQIVPAGARQIAPGVFQQRGRRGGAVAHKKKSKVGGSKHSFFARQWVWFALALMLGEVAQATIFRNTPKWMSVPALILYAYGKAKNKPGAVNAAYALQGARLLAYFGVTGTLTGLATKALSGGGFSLMSNGGGGGGGGGGNMLGNTGSAFDVNLDNRTYDNVMANSKDAVAAAQLVASLVGA